MSIGLIFLMSLACVAGAIITLCRVIGMRNLLRYATWVDVIFTVILCIALAGTLTGLLIGIVAGLVMTGTLTVLKALVSRLDGLRADRAKPITQGDGWEPKYGWSKL